MKLKRYSRLLILAVISGLLSALALTAYVQAQSPLAGDYARSPAKIDFVQSNIAPKNVDTTDFQIISQPVSTGQAGARPVIATDDWLTFYTVEDQLPEFPEFDNSLIAVTDAEGAYLFERLPKGTHKVTIDLTTLPSDLQPPPGEESPVLWLNPGMTQTSAAVSTGVRFTAVYHRSRSDISGVVFLDENNNGRFESNEPVLADVRVIDPTLHQYFVPFDDDFLWEQFRGKAQCHNPALFDACGPMQSKVFVTASSNGTFWFYDHYEDGYDSDPVNPATTTEQGTLNIGGTVIFDKNNTPPAGSGFAYDGRDRITIFGDKANVVRLANANAFEEGGNTCGTGGTPNSSGWLAAAWEVPEVADWGTDYVATVGEDLSYPAGNTHDDGDDHAFSAMAVMALQDNTQISYNGSVVANLSAGQVYTVAGANNGAGSGGVDSDDSIAANNPVQVQMFTGACGNEIVSAHGYTLQPTNNWDTSYWVPTPGFLESCVANSEDYDDADTDIYLHNPSGSDISVSVTSGSNSANVSVPSNSSISVLNATGWEDLAGDNNGTRLSSSGSFWGMVAVDSATSGGTEADDWDWGYSLLPDSDLTSQVVMGYAPGRPDTSDNGNLAFVIALADTVIYVDLNYDGIPDDFDMNGDGDANDNNVYGDDETTSDQGISVAAGEVLRVGDPNDRDLMGARIYTRSAAEKISVAWGQDPCTADWSAHDDLGYTVFPFPATIYTGAIGNYVWLDENGDGYQDPGEAGIPNVVVELTTPNGDTLTTVTDANGGYLFNGLAAGDYTVNIQSASLPTGLVQTTHPVLPGADFGNQTLPYQITLAAGEENLTADFGYNWAPSDDVISNENTGAIGDRVWIDADSDGVQDPGEPGIANVPVTLYTDPDGDGVYDTVYGTTTTDAAGNYIFDDLPADAYVVTVTPPTGYTQTGDPDDFGLPATAPDNTTTAPIILGPGDVFVNADFGYLPSSTYNLGDTIWFDADADGTYDPGDGEYGIAGVTVALLDSNGDVIATTITDENGTYLFTGLPNGDYTVWVNDTDSVLTGLAQTGDPDSTLDNRSTVTINNADDLDQDFGYTPPNHTDSLGLIGDTIFRDDDNDGLPDPGEGLEGIEVTLSYGDATITTVTDENGHYSFGELPPGVYTVTVTPPPNMTNSVDPDGSNDNTSTVTLGPGEVNLDQDFGYVWPPGNDPLGSIGNLVWRDANADGIADGVNGPDGLPNTDDDEPGIAGVTLELYRDTNGNGHVDPGEPRVGTTATDTNGNYAFNNLVTDDGDGNAAYVVKVTDLKGVLNGYWHTLGTTGADNHSQTDPYAVTLTPDAPSNNTADFGYYVDPAALGNLVWEDENGDGIQNNGEPGIANATVILAITYPDGSITALVTRTDANGHYEFNNLLQDENYNGDGVGSEPTFTISVQTPENYTPTTPDTGSNDQIDSDNHAGVSAQPVQGLTDVSAQPNPNDEGVIASYDFGFAGPPPPAPPADDDDDPVPTPTFTPVPIGTPSAFTPPESSPQLPVAFLPETGVRPHNNMRSIVLLLLALTITAGLVTRIKK